MRKYLLLLLFLLGLSNNYCLAALHITCPKAGEQFLIGCDTLITWEGILPTDTVSIEYSIDSGSTWKLIADNAVGLKYAWKNLPAPTSNQCLIKISRNTKYDTLYSETKIGNQTWMVRNLEVDHYQNGDSIEYVWDAVKWLHLTTGAWCYKDYNKKFGTVYGKLYNWYAVNDPRGLAPIGWHVASDEEWTELTTYLGGVSIAGGKLKTTGTIENGTGFWHSPNKGATNETSFSALPGSNNGSVGDYRVGYAASWCCSTKFDNFNAIIRLLHYDDTEVARYGVYYQGNSAVRCVKDLSTVISEMFSIVVAQILAKDVDMKKSLVGIPKDSLVTDFVYNAGTTKFQVDSIHFRGADANAFTIQSGFPKYVLNPSQGKDTKFRFIPNRVGIHTAEIVIYAETDTLIQKILGEGYKDDPIMETLYKPFPNLICGRSISNKIIITNTGAKPLIIKELNLKGNNSDEFSISETLPIAIDPNNSSRITVTFVPKSLGTKTADLEIVSNAVPNLIFKLPISATKDSLNLSFVEDTIDLGYLCPDESKDTIIHIKNFGTIAADAFLKGSPNIGLAQDKSDVPRNGLNDVSLKFMGSSMEGHINEIITLSDTICGVSKIVNIIGKVALPKLEANDVLINTNVNVAKQATITIHNKGDRDVTITNPPVLFQSLTWVANQFPAIIKAKDSTKFLIEFLPFDIQSFSISITFFANQCDVTQDVNIQLFADIPMPKLIVSIKNDSAYAGQVKILKLVMSNVNPEDIAAYASNFEAKIRFEKTILTLIKKSDIKIINDSMYLNVNGIIGRSLELVQIPVIAGLGLVEETTLDIVDFVLKDNEGNTVDYETETQAGMFELLGICREGGTRLINPTGKAEILSIIPNPASDYVEIKVNLIEERTSYITVYNSNGVKLSEFAFNDGTGVKTINLNAKEYSNGLYFIELLTPTVARHQKLMIVK